MVSARLLLGQVNSMVPRIGDFRRPSLGGDFAFVSRMFAMVGKDIEAGINGAEKSNREKGKGCSKK